MRIRRPGALRIELSVIDLLNFSGPAITRLTLVKVPVADFVRERITLSRRNALGIDCDNGPLRCEPTIVASQLSKGRLCTIARPGPGDGFQINIVGRRNPQILEKPFSRCDDRRLLHLAGLYPTALELPAPRNPPTCYPDLGLRRRHPYGQPALSLMARMSLRARATSSFERAAARVLSSTGLRAA